MESKIEEQISTIAQEAVDAGVNFDTFITIAEQKFLTYEVSKAAAERWPESPQWFNDRMKKIMECETKRRMNNL